MKPLVSSSLFLDDGTPKGSHLTTPYQPYPKWRLAMFTACENLKQAQIETSTCSTMITKTATIIMEHVLCNKNMNMTETVNKTQIKLIMFWKSSQLMQFLIHNLLPLVFAFSCFEKSRYFRFSWTLWILPTLSWHWEKSGAPTLVTKILRARSWASKENHKARPCFFWKWGWWSFIFQPLIFRGKLAVSFRVIVEGIPSYPVILRILGFNVVSSFRSEKYIIESLATIIATPRTKTG